MFDFFCDYRIELKNKSTRREKGKKNLIVAFDAPGIIGGEKTVRIGAGGGGGVDLFDFLL